MKRDIPAMNTSDLVRSVIETRRTEAASDLIAPPRKPRKIITFMGAKGGVGTTTVALNTAAALARASQVILAEVRPTLGTLSLYFNAPVRTLTIANLLDMEFTGINSKVVEAYLWSYEQIPGLWFLFGPRTMEQRPEIRPGQVRALLTALAKVADYVIVDVPTSLGETNRAVIEDSSHLVLVIERDALCVQTAKLILHSLGGWTPALQVAGAVIVNRAALATPVPIQEIDAELGIPTLRLIPPAPDLCNAAQNAGSPVVTFDPESLVAGSMVALAERLAAAPARLRGAENRTQMASPLEPAKTSTKILVRASKHVPQAMVSQYLLKCRDGLPALKAALARYEYEFARTFGHQMKGTGGAYGFRELTEVGALIERAATDQNIGELRNQITALKAYLDRVEVTFDESPTCEKP
jgi:Flp pilus assembly CpaE family ATPase/HPt (histidine-containing phosphotransfer) domain-containing protein